MGIFEEATKLSNERYNRDKLLSTTSDLIARFRLSAEDKSKMQGACRHLADALDRSSGSTLQRRWSDFEKKIWPKWNAGTGSGLGTFPFTINPGGVIAGEYFDANGVSHGFLREREGTVTTFDAPGPINSLGNGAPPLGLNPKGEITGTYCDAIGCHGFLRERDGTLVTFYAPSDVNGTYPNGIDPAGAITGTYADASGLFHGFLRSPDGTFTTFDVPGAGNALPTAINPDGEITGAYFDASGSSHGFLLKKNCDRKGQEKDCEGDE